MNSGITFGICLGPENALETQLQLIHNIGNQKIPDCEIIFVGNNPIENFFDISFPDLKVKGINFDEKLNDKAWITRKKNLITQKASFDTIVYMHDYFRLDEYWWLQWRNFKHPFDIAINRVLIQEEQGGEIYRHSDWLVCPYDLWDIYPQLHWNHWELSLPYEYRGLTKIQYISGGYWLAKKQFMIDNPLDETLAWGDAEDVEWSKRVRQKTNFVLNPDASVWIAKKGKWKPGYINPFYLKELIQKHSLNLHIEVNGKSQTRDT